jgi:uncharacterized protein YkwD
MLHRQYFAHGSVVTRARLAGAHGPLFGETLAWNTSGFGFVSRWLASPPHRAILLRPGFRRVGVGLVHGTFSGHADATLVTADFAGR